MKQTLTACITYTDIARVLMSTMSAMDTFNDYVSRLEDEMIKHHITGRVSYLNEYVAYNPKTDTYVVCPEGHVYYDYGISGTGQYCAYNM